MSDELREQTFPESGAAMIGRERIFQADRPAMRPVETHSKTRVIVHTRLMTDGQLWKAECSCGWWKGPFVRQKTARRHFEAHKGAHK